MFSRKKTGSATGGQNPTSPFSGGQDPFSGGGQSSSSGGGQDPFSGSGLGSFSGSGQDPFGQSVFASPSAANSPGSAYDASRSGSPDAEGKTRFDPGALIASLIGATVGAFAAMLLIGTVLGRAIPETEHPMLHGLLAIGLAVALVGGFSCLALTMYANRRPSRQRAREKWPLLLLAVLAGLMCLGMLLQFLYSLGGGVQMQVPDDVILLIDDSGSMYYTDPRMARVSSAKSLLDQLDNSKRAGMIFFTDSITYRRNMEPLTDEARADMADAVNALRSDGGTSIALAIEEALNMAGAEDPDRVLEIVMLTDGDGGYIDYAAVTERCERQNAHISAIALSRSVEMNVLNRLANATNGQVLQVGQIDRLTDAYSKLAVISSSRDLLGLRPGTAHDSILPMLFRVLAWAIIGAAIGISILLLLDPHPYRQVLPVCAGAGLLFGVLLEIANALWWDGMLFGANSKIALMPMLCIAILFYREYRGRSGGMGTAVIDVDLSKYQDSLQQQRDPKYDTLGKQ